MKITSRTIKTILSHDLMPVILISAVVFCLHMLINNQYGFHRDELAFVDDGRHLAWGYVAYPPLTPFIAHLSFSLFGPSLVMLRMFAALAQSVLIVLTALMAKEMGGSRPAQILAAAAAAIMPASLFAGSLFQYVSFDALWGVLLAYLVIRLLKTEEPRLWLAIGVVIGLGMMTRYTIVFLVIALVLGVLLTPARRYLRSPWLWAGVAISVLIALPNLIWQIQHDLIWLDFQKSIHLRDVLDGRTSDFWKEQIILCANLFTIPLWVSGLYYYFFHKLGKQYRLVGWMYIIPLALYIVLKGRGYYLAPAYPMLLAGGVVYWEQRLPSLPAWLASWLPRVAWGAVVVGGLVFGPLVLPVAPVNSKLWEITSDMHSEFVEQVGWSELVETVADIYHSLPAEEQAQTGILTLNYGEAGAINLYGPAYGLPEAISAVNSYWLRGYGEQPPQTVIVLGYESDSMTMFNECKWAGRVTNRYNVLNEESEDNPDIYLCRGPRWPWAEMWKNLLHFG